MRLLMMNRGVFSSLEVGVDIAVVARDNLVYCLKVDIGGGIDVAAIQYRLLLPYQQYL
jgi:hypothetical protein